MTNLHVLPTPEPDAPAAPNAAAVVLPFIRPRTSAAASRRRPPSSVPPGPGPAA
jgi:hypothetical protein